jgi:predicted phosphoribosyltransferase
MSHEMSHKIFDLPQLRDRTGVFEDRDDAGAAVAGLLEEFRQSGGLVLGIPAGGVPVGVVIARNLGLEFDVAVASKITPPWNSEFGYGAVAFDGTVMLNEEFRSTRGLSDEAVCEGVTKAQLKVERRLKALRGYRPMPPLAGRAVILVDDGLATGVTMLVAVEAVQKCHPARIIVAVPTGHLDSVERLAREADAVYCANIRRGGRFAVAEAYCHWRDMDESEIAAILAEFRPDSGEA